MKQIVQSLKCPIGLVVGSCTSHPGVLGSIAKREEPGKTGAPCVQVPGSSRPSPALGGLQIPRWLGSDPLSALWLGLAPATLEFWVRFPNERNQGKQAHPVLKYRVPHGSQASLIWPQKADTAAWWEEEEGQEYTKKHFNLQKIAKYFRTRSPVSAADIDGWRARELMAPLFMGDHEELQALIRDHLIPPYLFGDFHPSHIQEYAGGLLFALEKPAKDGGGIRPIICGESWRRCFASLAANAVWGPISHIFTSTYENFLQTAGLQDGASHCAKIFSSMYAALSSDPSDPDVIIKLDISNAFNVLCRQLTLDVLGGKASCD